jgi:hypothetical protein
VGTTIGGFFFVHWQKTIDDNRLKLQIHSEENRNKEQKIFITDLTNQTSLTITNFFNHQQNETQRKNLLFGNSDQNYRSAMRQLIEAEIKDYGFLNYKRALKKEPEKDEVKKVTEARNVCKRYWNEYFDLRNEIEICRDPYEIERMKEKYKKFKNIVSMVEVSIEKKSIEREFK